MTMSKRERVVQYFVAQARNCPDSQRDKFAEDRDRFDVFCGGIANSEQWIETYVERVEWGRLISRAYNEFLERRDLDQRCEGLDVGGEDGGEDGPRPQARPTDRSRRPKAPGRRPRRHNQPKAPSRRAQASTAQPTEGRPEPPTDHRGEAQPTGADGLDDRAQPTDGAGPATGGR